MKVLNRLLSYLLLVGVVTEKLINLVSFLSDKSNTSSIVPEEKLQNNQDYIDFLVEGIINKYGLTENRTISFDPLHLVEDENIGKLTDKLLEGYKDNYNEDDLKKINYAIAYSIKELGDSERTLGYGHAFNHPYNITRKGFNILENKLSASTIIKVLWHDLPEEHTERFVQEIEKKTGKPLRELDAYFRKRVKASSKREEKNYISTIRKDLESFTEQFISKENKIIAKHVGVLTKRYFGNFFNYILNYFTQREEDMAELLFIKNLDSNDNNETMVGIDGHSSFTYEKQLRLLSQRVYTLSLERLLAKDPELLYCLCKEEFRKENKILLNEEICKEVFNKIKSSYNTLADSIIKEGKRIQEELLKKYGFSELLLFKKPFYKAALQIYEKIGGLEEPTEEGDIEIGFKENPLLYIAAYLTPLKRPLSNFDGTMFRYSTLIYKFQDTKELKWPVKRLVKDALILTRVAEKLRDDPDYIPLLWIGEKDAEKYLRTMPPPKKEGIIGYVKNIVTL